MGVDRTYVPNGVYFVTTDVRHKIPFFRDDVIAGIMERSMWHERISRFVLYAYVIMPDHLHMLFRPTKGDVSEIMRSIKTNASRDINRCLSHSRGRATSAMEEWGGNTPMRHPFQWQQSFYDHVITSEKDFRTHVEYIRYNPVKAGLVAKPEDYPFLFVDWDAIRKVFG